MSLAVAVKTCPKCGEEKPLSAFYRDRSRTDGRSSWCGECTNENVKERQAKRREEMGEEAWLAHQRKIVQRSRAAGNTHDDEQRSAYKQAEIRLREAHRAEFDRYYREERYKRGLDV